MEQINSESTTLLHHLMDLGEVMLLSGAEVNRVEDTLVRMGKAYGASEMHVFVITSSVVVTMLFPDGKEITLTRRITEPGGTNFYKIEALNALSRRCCANPLPISELADEIQKLHKQNGKKRYVYLGSTIATISFAVFFGGTLLDGLAAAAFGLFISAMQQYFSPFCRNKVIFNFIVSLLSGLGICGFCRLFPSFHRDMIMIGDIMLLIPGIAVTNSIRDMLVGDTIFGIMRLVESLLWAGALAFGCMSAIWIMGV